MHHLLPLACPFLDPVIARLGPLTLNWYGVMYTLGILAWYVITREEILRKGAVMPVALMPELLFDGIVCGVIGARVGYVILYNLPRFVERPWEVFAFWQGGMSAHGWLVGMAVGGLVFIRHHRIAVRELADIVYLGLPLGLAAVKIGNFINCEGFGLETDLPWGIAAAPGSVPRHPSQLYEAFFEGFFLFAVLWLLRKRRVRPGDLSCFFLVGYGSLRFIIDFTREPDLMWGYRPPWGLTSGQILSIAVVVFGLAAYVVGRWKVGDGRW
jgi:phosphatidylglycerol:prolipoprotein diacylglycerol transferase